MERQRPRRTGSTSTPRSVTGVKHRNHSQRRVSRRFARASQDAIAHVLEITKALDFSAWRDGRAGRMMLTRSSRALIRLQVRHRRADRCARGSAMPGNQAVSASEVLHAHSSARGAREWRRAAIRRRQTGRGCSPGNASSFERGLC